MGALENALVLPPETRTGTLTLYGADGTAWSLALAEVVRAWRPNAMDLEKSCHSTSLASAPLSASRHGKPTRKGASSLPSSAPF